MNSQDLLVDSLRKLEYNEYTKPFYCDLVELSKRHPKVVIILAHNCGTPAKICETIQSFLFDTNEDTKETFHPHSAYLLISMFVNYRPTPSSPTYYDE